MPAVIAIAGVQTDDDRLFLSRREAGAHIASRPRQPPTAKTIWSAWSSNASVIDNSRLVITVSLEEAFSAELSCSGWSRCSGSVDLLMADHEQSE